MINLNSIQFAIWEKKLKKPKNQSFNHLSIKETNYISPKWGKRKTQKNESQITNHKSILVYKLVVMGITKYSISSERTSTNYETKHETISSSSSYWFLFYAKTEQTREMRDKNDNDIYITQAH